MLVMILLLAFLLPAHPSFANTLICDIKLDQENHFHDLGNGKIMTDLSSGNTKAKANNKIKNLIEEKTVGTIKADKSTCDVTKTIDYESDGTLRGYKFYYVDCVAPDGKIVTVTNSYTVKTNRGVYQEATQINGNYAFKFFFIENCGLKLLR